MSFIPKEPIAILTASDVELLWRSAGLDELRRKHRAGDTRLYALLVELHRVRLLRVIDAASGTEERHLAASEDSDTWTVDRLARASRRAARTVRKDIADGELAATKPGRGWLISPEDARNYISNHR